MIDQEEMLNNVGGSEDLLKQILEDFAYSFPKELQKIESLLTEGNLTDAQALSHKALSGARIIVAKDLIHGLEKMEKSKDNNEFNNHYQKVQGLKDGLMAEIERILNELEG